MQQAVKSRLLSAFLSAISVTTAFGLAFYWNLEKPFWAGFTAMVISLSTIGQSVQKGLLRMVGTVAGAMAGLILFAEWGQQRWPLLIVLSVYIMFMIFLLLRSRQNSYFFYTAAIVAVLIVMQSRAGMPPFQLALARVEENLLGIIVYSVYALLLWPRSSLDALKENVFHLAGAHRALLAAQRGVLAMTGRPDPGLYQKALAEVKYTSSLLPAARLEDYMVRRKIQEWEAFFSLSQTLIQLQLDFLARLEHVDADKRSLFFPALDSNLVDLAGQYAALAAWRPGATSPFAGNRPSLVPLDLQVNRDAVRKASILDGNPARAVEENFARQSRLCLALMDSLDFLLDGSARSVTGQGENAQDISSSAKTMGAEARLGASDIATEWFTLTQLRQVRNAILLYWVAVLIWIYYYPPGGTSILFVEMSIMIGLVGFLAGKIEPVQIIIAFALGCVVAGFLYFVIMPWLADFTQLGGLLFILTFGLSWKFYLPAQGIMRTGLLLPWFALSGLTNTHVFDPAIFFNGALTFMLCAALIALVFYLVDGGHPARNFLRKQRHFLRAVVVCLAFFSGQSASECSTIRLVRVTARRTRVLWCDKLMRDLAPELMSLSFAFDEALLGQERQRIKLLALNSYEVARRVSSLVRGRIRGGEVPSCLAKAGVNVEIPARMAAESVYLNTLRRFSQEGKKDLEQATGVDARKKIDKAFSEADQAKALADCAALMDALEDYLDNADAVDWQGLEVEIF